MTKKIGFLFPGQGAQFVGMGKDLAEVFPAAQAIFKQADDLLGYSLSQLCFQGPEEQLTRTLYAQPAIFVTSLAALAVLREKYPEIHPSFSAGLSLGEFTALVAAGSLDFQRGLHLVAARASAMEKAADANPGTMASVMGLAEDVCEKLALEAGCELANRNSPDQFVMSGTKESIGKVCVLAETAGAKRAMPLKVGGAFHSRLMKPAEEDLRSALSGTDVRSPECPFIPNVLGTPVREALQIKELLAKQLTSSVRWIQTMEQAKRSAMDFFLEIGPGKVLKGLARKCQPEINVLPCGSVQDLEKIEEFFVQNQK